MESLSTYILAFIGAILIGVLSGCSAHVGLDWHGRSEKSDITETAKFRNVRASRY